jgi:hypothetical protein
MRVAGQHRRARREPTEQQRASRSRAMVRAHGRQQRGEQKAHAGPVRQRLAAEREELRGECDRRRGPGGITRSRPERARDQEQEQHRRGPQQRRQEHRDERVVEHEVPFAIREIEDQVLVAHPRRHERAIPFFQRREGLLQRFAGRDERHHEPHVAHRKPHVGKPIGADLAVAVHTIRGFPLDVTRERPLT